jgi:hypothetical protein
MRTCPAPPSEPLETLEITLVKAREDLTARHPSLAEAYRIFQASFSSYRKQYETDRTSPSELADVSRATLPRR